MCAYLMQVVAVNRGSRSKPSETAGPLLAKATKAPPKIIRKPFSEGFVSCKANQQMMLDVVVDGAPAPETSWWDAEGKEIKSTDVVKVSHAPNLAKLVFIPARRTLAGKYVLKAKNAHGEDEAEIAINVYGRPAKPRGPLEV